jgi:adenylate cyclase
MSDADIILNELCTPRLIEKSRHHIKYGGRIWHIDEYFGAHIGLVTAEVELGHEGESVDVPKWIGKEVTDDPKYRNANLATTPDSWRQT